MADQSISFEVDQVGVPVLVRVSYFPTWKVEGADGPYRVAPNFMVVVPTEQRGHADLLEDAARLVLLRSDVRRHRAVLLLASPR